MDLNKGEDKRHTKKTENVSNVVFRVHFWYNERSISNFANCGVVILKRIVVSCNV